jgi:hypothetical protein
MALADTQVELRAWLDRLAIQDLIYRYSDALNRADWEQCESVFARDAIWESPALGLRFENADSFVEMLRGTSTMEFLIQTPHAPVIRLVSADKAHATTTIHERMRGLTPVDNTALDVQTGGQINQELYGVYYDDVTRIDGEWKFTHRLFVPISVATGAATGEAVTPRSGLLRPE